MFGQLEAENGDNFPLYRHVEECEETVYLNKARLSLGGSGCSEVYNGAENFGISEQKRLGEVQDRKG